MDERIRFSFASGTSIFVGTVGPSGAPLCCRAIALDSDDDLATATVYVPIATSRDTLANLATTHRLAVVVTRPIEHAAVQLKGTSRTARLASSGEEAFVRSRLDGLADVLDRLGIPRRVTHSFAHWPAFAIEMHVDEIFEQTPGPRAGTRLR
jgi:pyridoxamine 5'-phosphate oxidase-like protein